MPRLTRILPLSGSLLLLVSLAGLAKEPFTVRDSIEMTRLVEPNLQMYGYLPLEWNVSGDGRYLAAVTKTGNLEAETVDYRLWVFPLGEVEAFVLDERKTTLPGRVVTGLSTTSNRPAILNVKWLADNRTLMFVGENPGEKPQVFQVDVASGEQRQRTEEPDGVVDFAAVGGDGLLIFAAVNEDAGRSAKQKYGFVHSAEPVWEMLSEGRNVIDDVYPRGRYFSQAAGRDAVRVNLATQSLMMVQMSIAPSGDMAIVADRRARIPEHWYDLDWGILTDMVRGGRGAGVTPLWMTQLMVVDLKSGETRPLLDVPNGISSVIEWSSDSKRVVVSDQFVPLDAGDEDTAGRRATVEVDVETGEVVVVALGEHNSVSADEALTTVTVASRFEPPVTLVKGEAGWERLDGDAAGPTGGGGEGPGLTFSISLDRNVPHEIVATHSESGKSRAITDFNPRLRDLELGTVELFDWESGGRTWKGGLLLPTDFEAGKRYPLVVQTHGFAEWEFLVDGPREISAAMAARALANKGFVVLQAPDGPRESLQLQKEAVEVATSYIDAIRVLTEKGWIDPDRVGIVGFSRTGFYVQHALIMSDFEFAAAVVADASTFGWWTYMFGFGFGGFQRDFERMLGGSPIGDGLQVWTENNPIFHLQDFHTPLRIESHQLPSYWDTYVLLRKLGRPVEMFMLPEAAHNPERSWERLASQQGALDWFAFWLQGEEDPDPAKADQYRRWRALRGAK